MGSPRLNVRISAPVAAQTQAAGPGGKLVLFTKLYDVAPDGTQTLQHRLISPVRVKDVTKPLQVDLPGVAQRFPAGHRIRLVIAGGDLAYANNIDRAAGHGPDQPAAPRDAHPAAGELHDGELPQGDDRQASRSARNPSRPGRPGLDPMGSADGGGDKPSESGSTGKAGGAVAGAGSGAQAANAFSSDTSLDRCRTPVARVDSWPPLPWAWPC